MKKIGIMIPCYNEQENIVQICNAVVKEITEELPQYDYEILIMDNCSTDNTRPLIREICKKNPKIHSLFTNGKTDIKLFVQSNRQVKKTSLCIGQEVVTIR